ncbi:MAG: molybdenum cofactor biosynthesis protein MoaE [Acidobacteriota bacterium]
MNVRVLTFASASDAVGGAEVTLELAPGTDVRALKERLERDYPSLGELWHRLAVAIDGEIVPDEAQLSDGCEVALLPPVSGGAPAEVAEALGSKRDATRLTTAPLVADDVARAVAAPTCGALLVFLGNVRNHHAGRGVASITYSAYESMAEQRIRQIESELEAQFEGLRIAIVHRLGNIAVPESSVVIAAASPHRDVSYDANRLALERLKKEVPIWKREHYEDGEEAWREEESLTVERATP